MAGLAASAQGTVTILLPSPLLARLSHLREALEK